MDNAEVIAILEEIAGLLEAGHAESFALLVRNALSGSAQTLEEFLRWNELWEEQARSPISLSRAGPPSARNLKSCQFDSAGFNSETATRTFEHDLGWRL
jgi:hypothetical protein